MKKDKEEYVNYHELAIASNQKQHETELRDMVRKAQKQAQNNFNELLIKEKENINLLSIQKIEELAEMKRKYEKLLKDQKQSKMVLEEEYSKLMREFSDYKRNQNLNRPVQQNNQN